MAFKISMWSEYDLSIFVYATPTDVFVMRKVPVPKTDSHYPWRHEILFQTENLKSNYCGEQIGPEEWK